MLSFSFVPKRSILFSPNNMAVDGLAAFSIHMCWSLWHHEMAQLHRFDGVMYGFKVAASGRQRAPVSIIIFDPELADMYDLS
jgi:hypothetical protein